MSTTTRSTDAVPIGSLKSTSETAVDDAARIHGTVSSSLPKRDGSSGRAWRTYLPSSNWASSCSCWTVLSSLIPTVSTTLNVVSSLKWMYFIVASQLLYKLNSRLYHVSFQAKQRSRCSLCFYVEFFKSCFRQTVNKYQWWITINNNLNKAKIDPGELNYNELRLSQKY